MKTGRMATKGLYIGAGAGLVAFALAGLLSGSFIGGLIGLNIAGKLFGAPVEATVLPRMLVGAAMVLGILFSGFVFVAGASLLGRTIGSALDAVRPGRTVHADAVVKRS